MLSSDLDFEALRRLLEQVNIRVKTVPVGLLRRLDYLHLLLSALPRLLAEPLSIPVDVYVYGDGRLVFSVDRGAYNNFELRLVPQGGETVLEIWPRVHPYPATLKILDALSWISHPLGEECSVWDRGLSLGEASLLFYLLPLSLPRDVIANVISRVSNLRDFGLYSLMQLAQTLLDAASGHGLNLRPVPTVEKHESKDMVAYLPVDMSRDVARRLIEACSNIFQMPILVKTVYMHGTSPLLYLYIMPQDEEHRVALFTPLEEGKPTLFWIIVSSIPFRELRRYLMRRLTLEKYRDLPNLARRVVELVYPKISGIDVVPCWKVGNLLKLREDLQNEDVKFLRAASQLVDILGR